MTTPASEIAAIPGSPASIRTQASKYTGMAEAIAEAIKMLKAVQEDAACEESDAVQALAGKIDNAGDRLRDLKGRYEVAGSQLTTYADVLEVQQGEAAAAVTMRDTATQNQDYYQRQYDQASYDARYSSDLEYRTEAATQARIASGHLQSIQQTLTTAGNKHAAAVEAVRIAGNKAADAIAKAIHSDGVKDSLWDKISGAMKDWVSANAGWLSTLKTILGALTAVVGLLSIAFPVLAPISLALAGATALLGLGLALTGEGSWLEFGLDMLGVLTFGVGAVAAKGVGLALKGMQAMRGLTYNRQVTTISQRIIHPIATRSKAIASVGDEFQSLLPAGQTLMTRMPTTTLAQKFSKEWFELSGRQVDQFDIIRSQAQLGANGIRAWLVEGMGEAFTGMYKGVQTTGTVLDGITLGSMGLDSYNNHQQPWNVPVLSEVASAWQTAKTMTTVSPIGSDWQAGDIR